MSVPIPGGRYIIYNRVLGPKGHKLAITYPGEEKVPVVVSPLSDSPKHIWIIENLRSGTSSIRPEIASNLEVGWGDDGPVVLPPGGYVWAFKETESGYAIQDGKQTFYWGLGDPESKTIVIGKDNGVLSRWILEKV